MAYYGKDLAASFRTVRGNTIQIAEEIPEDKYSFKASPETRTIGQTLVHIALGPEFQRHIHGNRISDLKDVNFPELHQNDPRPAVEMFRWNAGQRVSIW